jgi:hypothetical protein
MSVVFADAFYFVARLNRRDQHHERVLKFSRDFRARLLTPTGCSWKWPMRWLNPNVADVCVNSSCICAGQPPVKSFPRPANGWTARSTCITSTRTRAGR